MEALKLKGWVDVDGQLHLRDAIALPVGEVELVVWPIPPSISPVSSTKRRVKSSVKALEGWFEQTEPTPEDFDVDEARWDALKEKYDL
ncbi:hypothetical protein [Synechococcus sp. PCC 6312]|uniref:hypothetical protein n=1 Tax=Synechococcus sp. (strain ATCC 27167 / PCC 6312) TaxID=195253 RepID=UPI00029F25E2|nr:hypothetical protein [Synechococcus sp. PCC 6312]AFY60379.1 hypothetical protein Syn6312_1194 [Synechococcus sp. PCC 6312]